MTPHEMVDWLVPCRPVLLHRRTVPPILVELAVAEAEDLSKGVEEGLEESEKAGEPDHYGDGGELHQSLNNGREIKGSHLVEGVPKERFGVLSAGKPDEDAKSDGLAGPFEEEGPANALSARIIWLIYKGRRPPEVAQIAYGNIPGVRALRI